MLVGGFLGAGKTSALVGLARVLARRGERVAIVTNDQAAGLVDTAVLASLRLDVGEVVGACFCCDLPGLAREVERLLTTTQATYVLAEPTGSCTDLVATVVRPLERALGDRVRVQPLSVLVDPARLSARGVDADVDFLVERQLQEADVVVATKADRRSAAESDAAVAALEDALPGRAVRTIAAGDDASLAAWLDHLEATRPLHRWLRDLDYARYAAAEAALAWLNADVDVATRCAVDDVARVVVERLRDGVAAAGGVVGNVKAVATARDGRAARAGATSTWAPIDVEALGPPRRDVVGVDVDGVDADGVARGGGRGVDGAPVVALRVNARATIAPEALSALLDDALASLGAPATRARAAFRPRAPVPTERVVDEPAP